MPRFKYIPIVLFWLFLAVNPVFSQVKKSVRSAGYGMPKVSRGKAMIMCPIFEESAYPYQGIGFKLGDPFALTYKFYPTKHWALAIDAGTTASGLYSTYYRGIFASYLPDTLGPNQSIRYATHLISGDWHLEAKFLYQWDADKVSKGLQFYGGLGWQWRNAKIQYDYVRNKSRTESKYERFNTNRFTFGLVTVVGFEYSYFTLPVSAFIEAELFTDAFADPGYQRLQGGVGLRYIF
ncbi:MAG: hypothetical protein ACOVMQ_05185 [Cyclobacteriaceae bacterium]|jgi:hypothetical protein